MKSIYYILLTIIIIIIVMWFNSEPKVITYEPMIKNTNVNAKIKLQFSTAINPQSAINNLVITPSIDYSWDYNKESRTLIIIPTSELKHNTTYYVKLNKGVKHLLRKPSTNTYSFNFTTEDYKPFNISLLGDLVLYHLEEELAKGNVNYAFSNLNSDILNERNFNFTNLENPISAEGSEIKNKSYRFKSSPETLKILKQGNINAVALANNHALDFGPVALIDTIKYCEEAGITCVGHFVDPNNKPLPPIVEYRGVKIGLASYLDKIIVPTWHQPLWQGNGKDAGVEFIDENIIEDIKYLKANSDIVIVALHWGLERQKSTTNSQVELAHKLIDNGADIIMGHHPHVMQAIERYKEGIIFYSLGNFVFPPTNEYRRDTYTALVKVSKKSIMDIILYPIKPVNGIPHSMNELQAGKFYDELNKLSSVFKTDLELNGTTITVK